jgi:decaprenyl-phosphate phosphoribosyltransferase
MPPSTAGYGADQSTSRPTAQRPPPSAVIDDAYAAIAVRADRRGGASRCAVAGAIGRAARPRQWIKNVLLLGAPAAAGVLGRPEVLGRVAVAFVAFCAAAAGGYLLNDVRDAEDDRRHPRKRARPVASGALSERSAVIAGVTLLLAGLALAAALGWAFVAILVGYVALTATYTLALRDVAVLDLAAVAGCHVARAAAGGIAVGVPLSRWFLIVASFGSLFVVAGKRLGDLAELGDDAASARATLASYSPSYLRHVLTMSSAVAVTGYCLWSLDAPKAAVPALSQLSVVPLVLFLLRYALLLDQGRGGAPEELVLADRVLFALAAAWVALFAGAVYL